MTATAPAAAPGRRSTPRRLTSLMILSTMVLVVLGSALGLLLLNLGHEAEGPRPEARAARLGQIAVALLTAEDLAAQWTLKPSPERRAEFLTHLNDSARLLTQAAADRPPSAEALGAIQVAVNEYSLAIQTYWGSGKEGTLDQLQRARLALHTDALDRLEALAAPATSFTSPLTWWVAGACLLAVAALVWISIPLARSTHRYVNLGLLGAIVSVVVLGTVAQAAVSAVAPALPAGSTELSKLISARTSLREALALEHLGLTLKGSGGVHEEEWSLAMESVRAAVDTVLVDAPGKAALTAVTMAHTRVRKLAGDGSWTAASTQSLDTAADGSLGAVNRLDSRFESEINGRLGAAAGLEPALAVNLALAGIVSVAVLGMACAVWGINQRLREYR